MSPSAAMAEPSLQPDTLSAFSRISMKNRHSFQPNNQNGEPSTKLFSSRSELETGTQDLICVGLGPASLAIAIAIEDSFLEMGSKHPNNPLATVPKALYLEKNDQFSWHAGMQLPGAKMQISFLKDLATPRNPRSFFTFLNYLYMNQRLDLFINLGTFLPSRMEYEDYLRWCAEYFESQDKIRYGVRIVKIREGERGGPQSKVQNFEVVGQSAEGKLLTWKARNLVIAVGGQAYIPPVFSGMKNVLHSSQYAMCSDLLKKSQGLRSEPLKFVVIGSGQSAAEIFNDLWEKFPESKVTMIIKSANLKPSDDSPFVNEIFNADLIELTYDLSPEVRAAFINDNRATNYGVVRPALLEDMYDNFYTQRLQQGSDKESWRCRIRSQRTVISISKKEENQPTLTLGLAGPDARGHVNLITPVEWVEADFVFIATGYQRNAHEEMLAEVSHLLSEAPGASASEGDRFRVMKNYRLELDEAKVDSGAGIWLQGCNEATHGLSDTLLSVLAIRSGKLIKSMFDPPSAERTNGEFSGSVSN